MLEQARNLILLGEIVIVLDFSSAFDENRLLLGPRQGVRTFREHLFLQGIIDDMTFLRRLNEGKSLLLIERKDRELVIDFDLDLGWYDSEQV